MRWRRYGKDRLYVSGADGTRLGWQDLLTGECTVEVPDRETELRAAVHAHAGRSAESAPVPRAVSEPDRAPAATAHVPAPPAVVPPLSFKESSFEDLAQRRAGAAAREQAVALRKAAPVKTVVARLLGVHTEERAWRIGADGEEKVAAQLDKLVRKDPRWRVLHAVPVGERGSDIDHVVLGPGGVYTLNAKHHPGADLWVAEGTFLVNGQRQPYLRNSQHEATRAARLLTAACGFPVAVTGVVVPVDAANLVLKSPPRQVHVVPRMQVRGWLRDRPEVLAGDLLDSLWKAARRPDTWRPSEREARDMAAQRSAKRPRAVGGSD